MYRKQLDRIAVANISEHSRWTAADYVLSAPLFLRVNYLPASDASLLPVTANSCFMEEETISKMHAVQVLNAALPEFFPDDAKDKIQD